MSATSRKELEKERRREDILRAAEEVFRRKGYQGTTMDDVAEEAEYSKGTLYLYFGSKFALFAELSNRVLTKVLGEFRNIAAESLKGRDMLAKMLLYWAAEAGANIRRFRLAISWMASDDRPDTECAGARTHRENVGMIIGALAGAIIRGQADGSIGNQGPPQTLGCQVWAGMTGALLFCSRIDDLSDDFPIPVECDGFMEGFVALIGAGLSCKATLK